MKVFFCWCSFFLMSPLLSVAEEPVAMVSHAPSINGQGKVVGSIRQMIPEGFNLNGGAVVEGDWYVPGTPKVKLNGRPHFLGVQNGTGSENPDNYTLRLNNKSRLGHIIMRTDPVALPEIGTVLPPSGTLNVHVNREGDLPANCSEIRNLTINAKGCAASISPGAYGDFSANNQSGFVLGVAGGSRPSVYSFQRLTLNSHSRIELAGPVTLLVKNGLNIGSHAFMGCVDHPEWLRIESPAGQLNLNAHSSLYGAVVFPFGHIMINSHSILSGRVWSDRLTVNSGGTLHFRDVSLNATPIAEGQQLTGLEDQLIPIFLSGTDADGDLLEFEIVSWPTNGILSGTGTNLIYTPNLDFFGEDRFEFSVSDGLETSELAVIELSLGAVNDRPVIHAQAPPQITYIDGAQAVTNWAQASAGPDNESDQTLQFMITNLTDSASFIQLPYVDTDGTLFYEIKNGETGSFTFDLIAEDDGETANGGQTCSVPLQCTITVVEAPNNPPLVNAGSDFSDDYVLSRGSNLVVNSGAELDPQDGWTAVDGPEWQSVDGSKVRPFEGNRSFYPGSTATGEIYQDIDLSAYATTIDQAIQDFNFRVAVQSKDELRPDQASVILEFWGDALLDAYTFSPEPSEDIWLVISGRYTPPAGTRFARVRLLAERRLSNSSCDTWFDGIELCALTYPEMVLEGAVSDDGLPWNSVLTHQWTLEGAHADAALIFSPDQLQTRILFREAGTYTLCLTADDADTCVSDTVNIEWRAGACNQPPSVDAGTDVTVLLPHNSAMLGGVVSDDGLPVSNQVYSAWVMESGPAEVFFEDQGAAQTTAYFREAGTYVLRLTASDGEFSSSDTITVFVNCGLIDIDLGVAIDHSGSMGSAGNSNSKLYLARQSAKRLLGQMSPLRDQACLSSLSYLITGLSSDFPVLQQQVDDIHGGSSATDQGIRHCYTELLEQGRTNASSVIIALADGQTSKVYTYASAAKSVGMRVITIGFGTGVNDDYLQQLASTPADYYFVNSSEDIDAAFASIGRTMCRFANDAPVVVAGTDQNWQVGQTYVLTPAVSDDGKPDNVLSVHWRAVADADQVHFSQSNSVNSEVVFDVPGTYELQLTVSDGSLSTSDSLIITVTEPINLAPVVDAGSDFTSTLGVDLVPTVSDDGLPFGSSLSVRWNQLSGPGTVWFADPIATNPSVFFSEPGVYGLQLTAFDGDLSASDTVSVTVDAGQNHAPEVVAGLNQTVRLEDGAFLSGQVTDDGLPNEHLWAQWSLLDGPSSVQLNVNTQNLTQAQAVFTQTGNYQFVFRATDGLLYSEDVLQVTVVDNSVTNCAPVVDMGGNTNITTTTLSLNPSVSDDGLPSGSHLTFEWRVASGNSGVLFSSPQTADTIVTFPAAGLYQLELVVSDGIFTTVGQIEVQTDWVVNSAPRVEAGMDQTTTLSEMVLLEGAATDDGLPNGILSYQWYVDSGPTNYLLLNGSMETNRIEVGFVQTGEYTLRLQASDGELTGSDTVTITVTEDSAGNQAPTVNAGVDSTISTLSVRMNPAVADDGLPEGAELSYEWTAVQGGAQVQILNPQVKQAVVRFDSAGTYVLQLTVSDGELSTTDTVTIIVDTGENQPPVADAGVDQTASLKEGIVLQGAASDDGLPNGELSVNWYYAEGPSEHIYTLGPLTNLQPWVGFENPGIHTLQLVVSDGVLTATDDVQINVQVAPEVTLISPTNYQSVAVGETLLLSATATQQSGTVSSVEFFVDSASVGMVTNQPYTISWTAPSTEGAHRAYAEAVADNGTKGRCAEVLFSVGSDALEPVWADISSPTNSQAVTQPVSVVGTVRSLVLDEYILQYREVFSADDGEWIELARGTDAVEDGVLGTFDPTLLQNGFYELRIHATDQLGYVIDTVPLPVQVAGGMKIGAFSLAFEDVNVPVGGVPMTVTRTYDSRNAAVGDFGAGWDLGVSSGIRLRKNRNLGEGWFGDSFQFTMFNMPNTGYILDSNGDRIVTVNLSDGTVYKFKAIANINEGTGLFSDWPDNYRWAGGPFNASTSLIEFRPMDGTAGQLIPLDSQNQPQQYCFTSTPTGLFDLHPDGDEYATWNPTRFKLITDAGMVLILDEERGLIRMEDPNGSWLEIDDNGVVHSSGKTLQFVRDAKGIITEVIDPAGKSLHYYYDADSRLIAFENREAALTEYFYENSQFPHYLTRIVDPAGNDAVRTEYDDQGRLIRQVDAEGNEISFEHAVDDNMEIITDRLGRKTVHVYDEGGNVIESIKYLDGREIVTRREYDEYGNETRVVDPLGYESVKVYNERNKVISETRRAPDGQGGYTESVSTNSFDETGNLIAMTDFGGKTTQMGYDTHRNLTSMTDAAGNSQQFAYSGGNLASMTDAAGNQTAMTYDAAGNQLSRQVVDSAGLLYEYQTFEYDAGGNQTKAVDYAFTPGAGSIDAATPCRYTQTGYDAENRMVSTRVFDMEDHLLYETGTAYNALGKKAAETNAMGLVTHYEYDASGNLTETHFPDGRAELNSYDAENRLLSVQMVDGEGTVLTSESYEYDALDRKIRTTNQDGAYTVTVYDDIGRVTAEYDALGNQTLFEYDPTSSVGRRSAVVDALGNRMQYAYDESGNQVSSTDANGHMTQYFYDAMSRQTNVVFHDSSSTSVEYDELGRRAAEVDAMGHRKEFNYNAIGHLTAVTQYLDDGSPVITRTTYDSSGRMLTQTDAENHTTTFEYDVLGRRTVRELPGGERESFTYDVAGNVLMHTDFNGYVTTYEYDAFGRCLAEVADPSHPSLALDHAPARIEYEYDAGGNRIKETLLNAEGVQIHKDWMGYNGRGELLWHHSSYNNNEFAHSFTYGRDVAGNLISLASSTDGGASTVLEYDALNRLQKVAAAQNPDGSIASYTYDNVGSLSAVQYANGIEHAYTYDMLNRLTNLAVSKVDPSSGSLSQVSGFAYTLNAIGYRTSVVEHSGREAHYTYDSLGRLTREQVLQDPTVINGWSNYTYDNVGNRRSRQSSGFMPSNQDFDYDANDRAYGSPLGDPAYDANGNTIRSDATLTNSTTVSCVDTYDYRNRLIRRVRADGVTLDYTYNAKGTRIAKTKRSGGVLLSRKLFVVDDQNLTGYVQTLEEWTAEGFGPLSLSKVYDYGLDLIAQAGFEADARNSSFISHTSYFVYDGHGSVRGLTDETGTITDTTTYDAFGIQLSQTGSTDNAYLYAGEYFDDDLGLYYLRARHMNPETGRFHTLDTYKGRLGEPLSLHKYMYAHANPVMGLDPSGKMSLMELTVAADMNAILQNVKIAGATALLTWMFVANPIEISIPRVRVDEIARKIRKSPGHGIIGENQNRVLFAKATRYRLAEVLPDVGKIDKSLWVTINHTWIRSLKRRSCLIIDIGHDVGREYDPDYGERGFFYALEQEWTKGYRNKVHDFSIPGSDSLSLGGI